MSHKHNPRGTPNNQCYRGLVRRKPGPEVRGPPAGIFGHWHRSVSCRTRHRRARVALDTASRRTIGHTVVGHRSVDA
eukprot:4498812-Prymnesium_polylepis.1